MTFVRAKQIPPHTGNWYLYEVESYSTPNGPRQRHIRYIGKEGTLGSTGHSGHMAGTGSAGVSTVTLPPKAKPVKLGTITFGINKKENIAIALNQLKNEGINARVLSVSDPAFIREGIKKKGAAFYWTNPDTGVEEIVINQYQHYWDNPKEYAEKYGDTGNRFFSTNNPARMIIHEYSHYLHDYSVDSESVFINDTTFREIVKEKVGKYAASGVGEFIAEVYTGLETGRTYSESIMSRYNRYKQTRYHADRKVKPVKLGAIPKPSPGEPVKAAEKALETVKMPEIVTPEAKKESSIPLPNTTDSATVSESKGEEKKTMDAVQLTGSAKQVSWASDLRQGYHDELSISEEQEKKFYPEHFPSKKLDMERNLVEAVDKITDAKWLIDHRNVRLGALVKLSGGQPDYSRVKREVPELMVYLV